MLIGYNPDENNRIEFMETDSKYLHKMAKVLGREMTVDDFWQCEHNLISVHVDRADIPVGFEDEPRNYRYDGETGWVELISESEESKD